MKLSGIPTPALVVDINTLKANMAAMRTILEGKSIKLRPHFKSHKCAALAKWQLAEGAIGMTCAKLGEAEDLCDAGVEDILIANQVVEPAKIRRMADLANNCHLTVCVDTKENISAISTAAAACGSTVYCFVEFEIGMERCGVQTKEEVLELVQHINACPNVEFAGIQAYAGHISHMAELSVRQEMTAANYQKIRQVLAYLKENGITVNTVSGGSTGTSQIKAAEGLYTELQAGSYLFMDATYRDLNTPFQNSLFLLTTVVSRREGLTVVDCGIKTCGLDQGMPVPEKGAVQKIVDSEEHLQLHGYTEKTQVGQKIRLIPAHCCSTVNLHDKIYLVDGDKVVDRIPVTARIIGR